MVTKFYDLKEVINEQLSRIEDQYLRGTSKIHIDFIDPHNDETPYYQITLQDFDGHTVVV